MLLEGELRHSEIIVSHSGSHDPTREIAAISDVVKVLHHPQRLLGGGARNRGAAVAKGDWLAFVDADVRPRPDWLRSLLASGQGAEGRFVVGSVGVASSGGYWGMCNWLCEFSEQAPWGTPRVQTGGASCNMLVRATDFHEVGGFPEDYQPSEDTMLFARLRAMGREQWFAPAACVDHHNQTGLGVFLRHQYRLGFHRALVRQQSPLPGSMASRVWPIALFLWVPRLALLAGRILGGGVGWWLRGIAYAPGLLVGSWLWTAGFFRDLSS